MASRLVSSSPDKFFSSTLIDGKKSSPFFPFSLPPFPPRILSSSSHRRHLPHFFSDVFEAELNSTIFEIKWGLSNLVRRVASALERRQPTHRFAPDFICHRKLREERRSMTSVFGGWHCNWLSIASVLLGNTPNFRRYHFSLNLFVKK